LALISKGVKLEEQNLDEIERSAVVEEAKGSDGFVVGDQDNTDEENGEKNDANNDSENEDNASVSLAIKGGEEWD
jgi:hypothetical protein